jgi:hypothetical protein
MFCDDGTMPDDNKAKLFCEKLIEAMTKTGRTVPNQGDLSAMLSKAGFTGVVEDNYKHPWGPWPKEKRLKECGMMMLLQGETAFSSYGKCGYVSL